MAASRRLTRALLGLGVAVVLLLGVELLLRAVVPVSDGPQPVVRARWNVDGAAFQRRGDEVIPGYQGHDMVRPFTAEPPAGVSRVFVLGGSSIRGGSGIQARDEVPGALEGLLREAGHPVEVLNLGRPGLDSHHHRLVLGEAVAFQPDVVVLYIGHNDIGNAVLEDRYGTVGASLTVRARLLLDRLASYRMLKAALAPSESSGDDPAVAAHEQGRRDGLALTCPPDDPRRALAARDLQANLEAMVRDAHGAGADVVLVTPVANWVSAGPVGRSCPELSPAPERGRGPDDRGGAAMSPAALAAALEQDPGCPELLFERGLQRLERGDPGAYDDLRAALEGDQLPLRATRAMTDAVRAAAASSGATLLDLEADAEAAHGAPPPAWFRDVVHLSVRGHGVIARALVPVVQGLLDEDQAGATPMDR